MKQSNPIQINRARQTLPAGGIWQERVKQRGGRVLRLLIDSDRHQCANLQAQAAIAELVRLLALDDESSWNGCAILARTHRYLWAIQAWCERHNTPYLLTADKDSALPIVRQRSFVVVIDIMRKAS